MKKLSLILVIAAVWVVGCKKVEKILTFNIKNERTFTVKKELLDPNIPVMDFPVSVASNADEEFKKNNTIASLVKDIRLTEAVMTLPDSDPEDFGFMKDVEIYISMADGSERVLLAEAHNIPETVGRQLVLQPAGNKMDKYVKSDNYNISMQGKLRRNATADLNVTSKIVFKVTAALLD